MAERALELPRDEAGRVVGYGVGREHDMREWLARREERADDERVKAALRAAGAKTRRRRTKIDWSAQPLGVESDAEIARRLGVAPSVVCNARKRLGIESVRPMRRWTRDEDRRLRRHYEKHGFGQLGGISAELGRTEAAVSQRIASLRLARKVRPARLVWPKALGALAEEWGYSRCTILVAAARLGIVFPREGGRRVQLVSREHAALLRAELAKHPDGAPLKRRKAGEWAPGEACVSCWRGDVPRHALERCLPCYSALTPAQRAQEADRLTHARAARRALAQTAEPPASRAEAKARSRAAMPLAEVRRRNREHQRAKRERERHPVDFRS